MIPKEGQHVKCVFRNGMVIEGIVEKWLPTVTAVLKSLEDNSILIITKPTDDIMLVKIMPEPPLEAAPEPFVPEPPRWEDEERANYGVDEMREEFRQRLYANPDSIENKFEEAVVETDHLNPEQVKTLAQLRIELNKQEREIISKKLRQHRPSGYVPGTTPYHYPSVVAGKPTPYQPGRIPNESRPSKKPRTK